MDIVKNHIIWLPYLDCSLKRKYGRRVPSNMCVDNPKPDEVLEVCKKLGLECSYIEKKYPRVWFRSTGFVLVKTNIKKNYIVKNIARELKLLRTNYK
ncbi:MAG: signal recognition particle subunit SRP19/SEC65 family protein [Ignisphaera sp.]|uniref:Signal recognition particle 19 kDa protein n=1 Tax=Ignisphaera aggregans TaxID=334771 RepID=A0A7J3MZP8_9CREN